jgi:hypothetical protein
MRLEVRCCCDPALLLGTLPVRDDLVVEGRPINFALMPDRTLIWRQLPDPPAPSQLVRHIVTLKVARMGAGRRTWLALKKTDEMPVDVLRRIEGFSD